MELLHTNVVPTLLRGTLLWDLVSFRAVLTQEKIVACGIPVEGFAPTQDDSFFMSKQFDSDLDHGELSSLAGNSMHTAPTAACLLFALACPKTPDADASGAAG